jgi:hypothetical protein
MTARVLQPGEVFQLLRLYGLFVVFAAILGGVHFAFRSPQDPYRADWAALSFVLLAVPASLLVMHIAGQLLVQKGVSVWVVRGCLLGLLAVSIAAVSVHHVWGAVASAILLPSTLLFLSRTKE